MFPGERDGVIFQTRLMHILVERFAVPDYERRIGTLTEAEYRRPHRMGLDAEAEVLQDVIGDPTIRWFYQAGNVRGFRSDEGYRIFRRAITAAGGRVLNATEWVRTRDGRRLTIDQLRAEQEVAAAGVAP